MARRTRSVAALIAAALLGGCVTSRVTTTEPGAQIWFDGRPVGRSGRIWSVGPPHTARVVVVAKDGRRARALVKRNRFAAPFEVVVYTMGACLVFCWAYPEDVTIPLPPAPPLVGWDDAVETSEWLVAPPAASREGPWGSAPATARR